MAYSDLALATGEMSLKSDDLDRQARAGTFHSGGLGSSRRPDTSALAVDGGVALGRQAESGTFHPGGLGSTRRPGTFTPTVDEVA